MVIEQAPWKDREIESESLRKRKSGPSRPPEKRLYRRALGSVNRYGVCGVMPPGYANGQCRRVLRPIPVAPTSSASSPRRKLGSISSPPAQRKAARWMPAFAGMTL